MQKHTNGERDLGCSNKISKIKYKDKIGSKISPLYNVYSTSL